MTSLNKQFPRWKIGYSWFDQFVLFFFENASHFFDLANAPRKSLGMDDRYPGRYHPNLCGGSGLMGNLTKKKKVATFFIDLQSMTDRAALNML